MAISATRARLVQDSHFDMLQTLKECRTAENKQMAFYAATGIHCKAGEYKAYLSEKIKTAPDEDKGIMEVWIKELEFIHKEASKFFIDLNS